MKMVKSLLLGSAATLIAVGGAQAADLPVKAKPVEYVKVCSLYGAGFYYIPGTDTCIKIGGYLRADFSWQGTPTATAYLGQTNNSRFDRADTADVFTRARFNTSWDVRTQTEYGTLRSFARVGWQATSQGGAPNDTLNGAFDNAVYIDRAMIQFAGFTFGKAQSFSDFSAPHSNGTYAFFSDTGGTGTNLIAYTAQFGNGLSLTVSAEDSSYRRRPLTDINTGVFVPGANAPSNYMGQNIPDFVAALRLDQAWGSAQISGAVHQVAAAYYAADSVPFSPAFGTYPGDQWGWNIRGGLSLNIPWGPGDQLILEGAYGEGATHYAGNNHMGFGMWGNGPAGTLGSVGMAWATDGVFATSTTALNPFFGGFASGDIELTTSWSAYASFQHFWTPSLRSSIVGGVFANEYGDGAKALICSSLAAGFAIAGNSLANCDPNFRVLQVGTRTIWSPVANLDLSLDVFYSKLDQNHSGNFFTGAGARTVGTYALEDQDTWTVLFRAQRNFWY